MKRQGSFFALAVLIAGLVVCPAFADIVTVTAAQDTYITMHGNLGGPDSNRGSDPYLFQIGAVFCCADYRSYPLVSFDLAAYSGDTVLGPGTLTFTVHSTWDGVHEGDPVTQTLEARPVAVSWDANTVTWNSLGGNYGPALDTHTFTVQDGYKVEFFIPAATIQGWIDSPSTNYGLLVHSQDYDATVYHEDMTFYSTRATGGTGPQLSIDLVPVPEPATFALLGGVLMGLAALRRRRV